MTYVPTGTIFNPRFVLINSIFELLNTFIFITHDVIITCVNITSVLQAVHDNGNEGADLEITRPKDCDPNCIISS